MGEHAAAIDFFGICLISGIDANDYRFHLSLGDEDGTAFSRIIAHKRSPNGHSLDDLGRCRWSTNVGEDILFVKYDRVNLNMLDVEKKALTLKYSIRCDGNYL